MPIDICDYDCNWPARYEAEASRLEAALVGVALSVDHIGSTAVPGLAAKPVIDIQVTVSDADAIDRFRVPLVSLGYTYTTEPLPYFHAPATWPHATHVHVRQAGSEPATRTIAFRDWLRSHESDRNDYETLKRALANEADEHSVQGRYQYSEAKSEFISRIVALSWSSS